MKKVIINSLIFFIIISLAASVYFYIQYHNLTDRTLQFIHSEAQKSHADLGYSFRVNSEGILQSHPLLQWMHHNHLVNLFAPHERNRVIEALERVQQSHRVLIKKIDDIHNHQLNLYLTVKGDEIQGLLFFPAELKKFYADDERKSLIAWSLSFIALLCALFLLIGALFIINASQWWFIIIALSIIMLTELGFIWSLRSTVGFQEEFQAQPIIDPAQISNAVQKINGKSNQIPAAIPTGIFIEHMQFAPRGNSIYPGVFLSGYIWQKYDINQHKDIERGFVLANAYESTINKLYQETTDNQETIGWSFSCILYQRFKPTLYPFDHRHVEINIVHKNFEKNIILLPDIASYELLNPSTLPGIAFKTIPYWNIINSFFNIETVNYFTKLGVPTFNYKQHTYLQFFITLERTLGGDFLMYFVMLALVFIILFILLLAFLKQETVQELIGFSTMGVLGVCSSLLFVLVMSEIDLRHTLMVEGIIYFDFLYFVCYCAILGVIINGILFALNGPLTIINYKDNLIVKLFYWPCVLISIVLITAYAFY